jgi:hypothetical protein
VSEKSWYVIFVLPSCFLMISTLPRFGIVALSAAAALMLFSGNAFAQSPTLEQTDATHAGAPLDDGKGKGKPPYVPSTGPAELAAIAVAGAGFLTYRRLRKS